MTTSLATLIERRTKAEEELSAIKAEIASRAGEVDESLDPDPSKARKAPAPKAPSKP